jgi:hypothetical protein
MASAEMRAAAERTGAKGCFGLAAAMASQSLMALGHHRE